MKKKIKYTGAAAMAALFSLCAAANAEEEMVYSLEPDKSYEMDLQGDGTVEQLSYKTYTEDEAENACKAVLEIYVNDTLSWSVTDETWSYYWSVNQCPMEDGSTYLLVSSRTDNDWTNQTLLLAPDGDSFKALADLALLSRETEENPEMLVSGWGRCFDVAATEGNTITVNWLDTLKATGNITIPVVYEIADGQVTQAEGPWMLDENAVWTAWTGFAVIEDPENDEIETIVYEVEPGDQVKLTELIKLDGRYYLKCINQDGLEGWMPDAEEYISQVNEEGTDYLCGYFEEAIYAG